MAFNEWDSVKAQSKRAKVHIVLLDYMYAKVLCRSKYPTLHQTDEEVNCKQCLKRVKKTRHHIVNRNRKPQNLSIDSCPFRLLDDSY